MRTNTRSLLLTTFLASALLVVTGCATTTTSNTARTGTEQLLISSAIDRAMTNVQFGDFAGYKVFVDEKYLDAVDKGYLVGSIRHQILAAGGSIAAAADSADLVLEVRSGGIGTDDQESFVGIPAIGIPGLPIELPEVKLATRSTQMGTAKIGMICYDPKTGQSMGLGGEAAALTHNNDTYVLGVGPFRTGAVLDQRERAVGYNGVGGSFGSLAKRVPRRSPVQLVKATSPSSNSNKVPQVAQLPTETFTK